MKADGTEAFSVAEGFKGYVATDGSLLGTAGKWRACCLSMVQLDYDQDLVLLHGMYDGGRIFKRAELTAFFFVFSRKSLDLSRCICRQQRNSRCVMERRKEMHRPESW